MNRHQKRARSAQAKHEAQQPEPERGDYLDMAMRALADSADTATGATLFLPDGTITYIDRADADVWVAAPAPGAAKQ